MTSFMKKELNFRKWKWIDID